MFKFIGIAFLLLIGIFIFTNSGEDSVSRNNAAPEGYEKPDLIIGDPAAPATIVEYGDFKCPSCGVFHQQTAQQLKQEYIDDGQLKIVFRNTASIGPDSELAAQAAYCSSEQNKFGEYHDDIYDFMWNNYYSSGDISSEFQNILTKEKLLEIANESQIDTEQLSTCIDSGVHEISVDEDRKLASSDGARGTPTFIVNDQTISGPQSFEVFKALVDIQLR